MVRPLKELKRKKIYHKKRFHLEHLGKHQFFDDNDLSQILGCSRRSARVYINDPSKIPELAIKYLRIVALGHIPGFEAVTLDVEEPGTMVTQTNLRFNEQHLMGYLWQMQAFRSMEKEVDRLRALLEAPEIPTSEDFFDMHDEAVAVKKAPLDLMWKIQGERFSTHSRKNAAIKKFRQDLSYLRSRKPPKRAKQNFPPNVAWEVKKVREFGASYILDLWGQRSRGSPVDPKIIGTNVAGVSGGRIVVPFRKLAGSAETHKSFTKAFFSRS